MFGSKSLIHEGSPPDFLSLFHLRTSKLPGTERGETPAGPLSVKISRVT